MSDSRPPISYTFEVPAYPQVFVPALRRHRPYWLHMLLLLLTIATTLIVGARLQYNFMHDLPAFTLRDFLGPVSGNVDLGRSRRVSALGIPFSATLIGILLAHEFGHFLLAEKNHVYATLPYFIPAPTFIGTFGAAYPHQVAHSLAAGAVRYRHRRTDRRFPRGCAGAALGTGTL